MLIVAVYLKNINFNELFLKKIGLKEWFNDSHKYFRPTGFSLLNE